jgi:hypothetical protein
MRRVVVSSFLSPLTCLLVYSKPVDHATAKALLAGFAGSMVDKMIETKGLDYLDRQKTKRHAEDQVKEYYEKEVTY